MKKIPKIKTSGFGLIDITRGKVALAKRQGIGNKPYKPIPVTIHGFIEHAWGSDDGESQEFSLDIKELIINEGE